MPKPARCRTHFNDIWLTRTRFVFAVTGLTTHLAEAGLVLALYQALRASAAETGELPRRRDGDGGGSGSLASGSMPWCAVITPYADQLQELERRFRAAGLADEVELNTVDAFQVQ